MTRILRIVAIGLATLAFPATALAGDFTLHPSGFGEHSYSAWKGQEGLPDSSGSQNQALYFQKMTPTLTQAAGVAVIKGFEGMATASVLPLGFYYGLDGHCGAGAPRFNVRFQPTGTTDPALRQTAFVGCGAMVPGLTATAPNGRQYLQKTFLGPLPSGTIVSLAIVYDEGSEFPPGFVFLDNIQVGQHIWTSASDNGNGQTIMQSTDPLEVLLGEPLTAALGG